MARKGLKKGIFITVEGVEGCGKTTQSDLLCKYLSGLGYECVHTREPGGTKVGERIRDVLLHSKDTDISDLTELLLFEAARSQIVAQVISPAIKAGKIVVCDRFADATRSYQGYGGKVDMKKLEAVNSIATGGLEPDLTILLDIDTDTGLSRARCKGADRMEAKDLAYHKRVRLGYLKLARRYPKRIKVIKVVDGIERVQVMVRREVENVIQGRKRAG